MRIRAVMMAEDGADFLDVETFPELAFRSKRVEKVADGRYRVLGDLTVHGTTREVALEVEAGGTRKDPWGHERAGFAAHTQFDRKDFGLQWNAALETCGFLVGDEVQIAPSIQAVAQPVANAA